MASFHSNREITKTMLQEEYDMTKITKNSQIKVLRAVLNNYWEKKSVRNTMLETKIFEN